MVSIVFAGLIVAYSPKIEAIYSKKMNIVLEQQAAEKTVQEEEDINSEKMKLQAELLKIKEEKLKNEQELVRLRNLLSEKELKQQEKENQLQVELAALRNKQQVSEAEEPATKEKAESISPEDNRAKFDKEFQNVNSIRQEAERELAALMQQLKEIDIIQPDDVNKLLNKIQLINGILRRAEDYLDDVRKNFVEKNVIQTLRINRLNSDLEEIEKIHEKALQKIKELNKEIAAASDETEKNQLNFQLKQYYQIKLQTEQERVNIKKQIYDNKYILQQWDKQLTYEQNQIDNIKARAEIQLKKVQNAAKKFAKKENG
ncbi:MAG: hypothetical protein DRZ79_03105 [Candidatus Cloacimonadota bacterium]|nr:MAG: hypothetical protein DRZ79_03105 [Candidatus Cloacimonadota bacterium]